MSLREETTCVEAGRPTTRGSPTNPPVHFATNYAHGGEYDYARAGSPSLEPLEAAVGALEGGYAVAFSSGVAAVAAVFDRLRAGARVQMPQVGYPYLRAFALERAERGLIDLRFVDQTDATTASESLDGVDLIWIETPNTPLLGITDIAALARAASARRTSMAVDSTLATPLLQRPLELGAELVVHSVSKYLAGHSDVLLGVVCASDEGIRDELRELRTRTGAVPGPMESFLALRGIRTLAVRLERSEANAGELARRLEAHPLVAAVRYPGLPGHPGHRVAKAQMRGFGAVLSFELGAGSEQAAAVCARTRLIRHATGFGGVETLMSSPAGAPAGLVRVGVGCEHVEDLWADLEQALGQS